MQHKLKIFIEMPCQIPSLPGFNFPLQVAEYMDSLSRERVPHCNNPDGIKYYNKQLLYQIPLQDSNIENIKTLTSKQQHLLDAFKDERDPEMGKGIVAEAGAVKVSFLL